MAEGYRCAINTAATNCYVISDAHTHDHPAISRTWGWIIGPREDSSLRVHIFTQARTRDQRSARHFFFFFFYQLSMISDCLSSGACDWVRGNWGSRIKLNALRGRRDSLVCASGGGPRVKRISSECHALTSPRLR